ncbi:hypothetical protein FRC10_005074 [Ceratobasidium sp. 414]|nr:hypothetical protein FRC10_005074 [Ceratobasidium sp. 414]
MVRRMRTGESSPRDGSIPWNRIPALQYLHSFTHGGTAFAALARVGSRKKFRKVVVAAATEIVHLAVGHDPALAVESVELHADAVPGFLDVVSIVAKHCRGIAERNDTLLQFSSDAFELVKVALKDRLSRDVLGEHPAPQELWNRLHAIGKDSSSAQQLIEKLREDGKQLGIVFNAYTNQETDPDENAGEGGAGHNGDGNGEEGKSDDEGDSSDEDAPKAGGSSGKKPEGGLESLLTSLQKLRELKRQLDASSD